MVLNKREFIHDKPKNHHSLEYLDKSRDMIIVETSIYVARSCINDLDSNTYLLPISHMALFPLLRFEN